MSDREDVEIPGVRGRRKEEGAGKVRSKELARTKREGGAETGGASGLKRTLSGWVAFWLKSQRMVLTWNW